MQMDGNRKHYPECGNPDPKIRIRPEDGTRSHYDGCEPPCGCWELNSGPLEKQPVLLTTESFLQPPKRGILYLSLPAACRSECGSLHRFSSTMSACVSPCPLP
ncbi:hypothetical protein LEMLEM_LOCUS11148 [Lemmus lemmus]